MTRNDADGSGQAWEGGAGRHGGGCHERTGVGHRAAGSEGPQRARLPGTGAADLHQRLHPAPVLHRPGSAGGLRHRPALRQGVRAEPAELNDLLRYWEAATEQGADSGLPAAVSAVSAVPIGAESWAQAPLPVAREMFGVTMNSFSGVMPAFRVGAVRLWDSETRWSQLEPARGVFDFSTLDRLLDGAERQSLPVTFVFGGTPGWAAPNGREAAYREDCRAAPGARPHPLDPVRHGGRPGGRGRVPRRTPRRHRPRDLPRGRRTHHRGAAARPVPLRRRDERYGDAPLAPLATGRYGWA